MSVDSAYNPLRLGYWIGPVDSRPVAAFRICYGALLLKDALYHLPIARAFYSDEGVLPRTLLPPSLRVSLLYAVGTPDAAVLFFVGWAIAASCLMLGYRTRLAAFLNYVALVSVHYRNPYVTSSADTVMRILGFWGLFLPLADHYSIDAMRRGRRKPASGRAETGPPESWALPLRLAQIQVMVIYLATAGIKMRSDEWLDGDALFYVGQLKSILLPLGELLFATASLGVLRLMSLAVLWSEWCIPFLVFSPIGQPALRRLGLGLGFLLHVGVGLTMAIPNFSEAMLLSYWLFVSGDTVGGLTRRLGAILYRGRAGTELADSPSPERLLPPNGRSRVLRPALGLMLVFIMASLLWYIAAEVYYPLVPRLRGAGHLAILRLGLEQHWKMFGQTRVGTDGWVEFAGLFEDGRWLDVRRGGPISNEGPRWHAGPWARWWMMDAVAPQGIPPVYLRAAADYYCRVHAGGSSPRLLRVELAGHYRAFTPPGAPLTPYERRFLLRHDCLLPD